MATNHDDLVATRNAEYGEAYQITDQWIKQNLERLAVSPSPFSLIMIHNKLTRALATPMKADHYDDIIGYTKLLLRELEADNKRQEEKERILDSMPDFSPRNHDVSSEEYDRISGHIRENIWKRGYTG